MTLMTDRGRLTEDRRTPLTWSYLMSMCHECEGTGRLDANCPECEGRGWVDDPSDGGTMVCPSCDDAYCPNCNGTGDIDD